MTAIILDALLEAQGQRLDRVLDIHQRFTRIVASGGGTFEIATTLHDLLGIPVAVIDAEGRQMVVVPSDVNVSLDDALRPVNADPCMRAIMTTVRSSRLPAGWRSTTTELWP